MQSESSHHTSSHATSSNPSSSQATGHQRAPQKPTSPKRRRSHGRQLGTFRGMTIGVHWSLFVFGIFAVVNLAGGVLPVLVPGYSQAIYLVVAILATIGLFGSILLHELGHAVVAQNSNVEVDGVTLWLLGGVARLKSEARSPDDAFRIAAAGPAVSVALSILSGAASGLLQVTGASSIVVALFAYLGIINLGLALFNLIPALPLDGGRIAQAYLWHRDGDRLDATISAARLGRSLGFVGVGIGLAQLFAGVSTGLWTIMLAWFVMRGANRERRAAEREKRHLAKRPAFINFFDQFGGPGTPANSNRHPWHGEAIPVKSWEEHPPR